MGKVPFVQWSKRSTLLHVQLPCHAVQGSLRRLRGQPIALRPGVPRAVVRWQTPARLSKSRHCGVEIVAAAAPGLASL
jgi:hypothetical protein